MKSAEVMTEDKIVSEKDKYIEKRAVEIGKWHGETNGRLKLRIWKRRLHSSMRRPKQRLKTKSIS